MHRGSAALLLAAGGLAGGAAGHGVLTLPGSRNGGSIATAGASVNPRASWFSLHAAIPGAGTNCAASMATVSEGGCASPKYGAHPWMAPGSAPVTSPCGRCDVTAQNSYPPCDPQTHPTLGAQCCGEMGGVDGVDLPRTPRAQWRAGGEAEVAWAIQANHGGGYAYRLCPADEAQDEACFQRTPLDFAGNTSVVRWSSGEEATIPAVGTAAGTAPAGSMWRRNPIPLHTSTESSPFGPPCDGCAGGLNRFSIVDRVALPTGLGAGNYTLSWRWDCEQSGQVWSNCADVTVLPARASAAGSSATGV